MVSKKSLQRYIDKCNAVLMDKNVKEAERLQDEIIAVFYNDIQGLKKGLSNYSFVSVASFCEKTVYAENKVDFLGDIEIIKSRLIVELEKQDGSTSLLNKLDKKAPKVFISHSKKDIGSAIALIDMLERIGINEEFIFTSSVPGNTVPLKTNYTKYDFIAQEFVKNEIIVLFLLSKDYYNDPACLNEMGAAWILKSQYVSFFLPGFSYTQLDGAIDPRKGVIELEDRDAISFRLEELRDILIDFFELKKISNVTWERIRNSFLDSIYGLAARLSDNEKSSSVKDIEDLANSLKNQLGMEITVNTVTALGYTKDKANNIVKQLITCGYLEKAEFARYRWKKQG